MKGTLAISWGPWSGFYVRRGFVKRACLGWVAVTYVPVELDDMMEASTERAERRRGSLWRVVKRQMDSSVLDWSTDTVRVRLYSDDETGDDGHAIEEKP